MREIWKDVAGTNGAYQVSNTGRVRSVSRTIRGKSGKTKRVKGRILTAFPNSTGYLRVYISANGVKKRPFVHRLVASAFVRNPDRLDVVNHKDFNPLNNHASNLEWTTGIGNYQYSFRAGRFGRTDQWKKNLKEALDITMAKPVIGTSLKDGHHVYYRALNDCARDGFQPSCVSCCCNGKRSTHAGYKWSFGVQQRFTA